MDGSNNEIGLVLTVLRSIWGWSQEEWARAARVGASSLSEYETGEKVPNLQTLERLFSALGLPLSIAGRTTAFIGEVRSYSAGLPLPWGPGALASVGHSAANLSRAAEELLSKGILGALDPVASSAAPRAEERENASCLWDRLCTYSAEASKALVAEL